MYSTAVSADGRLGIAGGQDSVLLVWLIDNGQLLRSFPAPNPPDNKPIAAKTAGG